MPLINLVSNIFIVLFMNIIESKDRTLVLHFDLNKCIIMCDPVKGFTLDDTINSMLAECVWGRIDSSLPENDLNRWKLLSPIPTSTVPEPGAISYTHFLENETNLKRTQRKPLIKGFTDAGGKDHLQSFIYLPKST